MPGLREVLQGFDPVQYPTGPEPSRTRETLDELIRQFGNSTLTRPPEDALERTYWALRQAAEKRSELRDLSPGDLRRAPWLIFISRQNGEAPLIENTDFLKDYLIELQRRAWSRAIVALVFCALYFYPKEIKVFPTLRKILRAQLLPRVDSPKGQRWLECVQDCRLLEDDGPAYLAERLENADDSPDSILDRCCLKGLLAEQEFVKQVFRSWVDSISGRLASGAMREQPLQRFLTFARDDAKAPPRLRLPTLRRHLAEGLLRPFADGNASSRHQPAIKTFLLNTLGDPRFSEGNHWEHVDDSARAVMLRWLVEATLEDFFRLLEQAAKTDDVARKHWKYRKAFWEAYLRAGHIGDAWVVLGPMARHVAGAKLGAIHTPAYGKISGPGVQNNHSVLIFRVGDLTITEWSHSGKYRVWFEGNKHSPRLYLRRPYTREQVTRKADVEGAHHGSENGTWQENVADLIRERTRISVAKREYMPHRG